MDESKFNVNKSQKAVDDIYALVFARPISKRISKALFNTKVTANQITIFSIFLGVISGILLFFDYNYISAVLLYFSLVFDCVDGELARLREHFTRFGFWMEGVFDRVPDTLPFFAMGYLTGEWLRVALALTCFFLIRTVISVNVLTIEKFGLEDSVKKRGFFTRNKFNVWFRYTKAAHILFLILFILTRQYDIYLLLFSTACFVYLLAVCVVAVLSCKKFDSTGKNTGKSL